MCDDIAIRVENLSKRYTLRQPQIDEDGNVSNEYWALKDVSFEIKKGESVGVIGHNGSGKSTLLKILAGVTKPTSGNVQINGRVASILDIGAGFHPELSGRENVFLSGQIHGFSRAEIQAKYAEIIAFSGIEKFIDEPVKSYSNGMYLRLAFSIVTHLDFDVYLFDEAINVGDAGFRERCFERISALVELGRTFVMVSHYVGEVAKVCDCAYFINNGGISEKLTINQALLQYSDFVASQELALPSFVQQSDVVIKSDDENEKLIFLNTENVIIAIHNVFNRPLKDIKIAIRVNDRFNNVVFNISPAITEEGFKEIDFSKNYYSVKIPSHTFNAGFYSVDLVYYNDSKVVHEIKHIKRFSVELAKPFLVDDNDRLGESGPLKPFYKWDV